MIDTDALRGLIAQRRLTQAKMAKMLNITPKTFYSKMKKGVFDSNQIEHMAYILNISDIDSVFFCPSVTDRLQNSTRAD